MLRALVGAYLRGALRGWRALALGALALIGALALRALRALAAAFARFSAVCALSTQHPVSPI